MWIKGRGQGASIAVNTDNITWIKEYSDGSKCMVHFDNNHTVTVEGSIAEILGTSGEWELVEVSFGNIVE